MLIACAASPALPPVMEVNAAVKPGSQLIISKITSARSTCGSIASTRLRRSVSEGGSGMALSAATCSLLVAVHAHVGSGPLTSAASR